jgi:dGTPase
MSTVPDDLSRLASDPAHSRGRRHVEPGPGLRTEFQRDRDRIVHSSAFRRLEYKTQVFVNHEGDLFRTRLTHSLEVAQIARSIARSLRLNEDLTEAISLAHDLGHTPFGHAGQEALNACMHEYGGFEHNLQSLRVVDELEQRYAAFDGLNLCFETREGILKHCSPVHARQLGELGERFLAGRQPSLEAQLANLADEIAYNNHDIDDGVRSGLLTIEQLEAVPLVADHLKSVRRAYPDVSGRRLLSEAIRQLINTLVEDLIAETCRRVRQHGVTQADEVALAPPLMAFSDEIRQGCDALKHFLRHQLYRHHRVLRMTTKAQRVVRELFDAYCSEPRLLPPDHRGRPGLSLHRAIADYIAGMTDRYAIREHRRLYTFDEP